MNYAIFIFSIGLLLVSGCMADGREDMFKRDSSSHWYNDAFCIREQYVWLHALVKRAISLVEELVLKRQSDELERQAKALPKKIS